MRKQLTSNYKLRGESCWAGIQDYEINPEFGQLVRVDSSMGSATLPKVLFNELAMTWLKAEGYEVQKPFDD